MKLFLVRSERRFYLQGTKGLMMFQVEATSLRHADEIYKTNFVSNEPDFDCDVFYEHIEEYEMTAESKPLLNRLLESLEGSYCQ